jgi:membrane protease YdiL (CAAX protease family)
MVGQVLLIGGSLLVAHWAFPLGLRRGLGLDTRHWFLDSTRAMLTLLAILPPVLGAMLLARMILPQGMQQTHQFLVLAASVPGPYLAMVIVSTVVLAPVGEELLFRGIIQTLLRNRLGAALPHYAAVVSLVLTSVIFAVFHVGSPQDTPAIFLLALALGYTYERTGRLLAPMLIHSLFNAVMILTWLTSV